MPNDQVVTNWQIGIAALGWLLFGIWLVVAAIPSLWMIGRSLKRQSELIPDLAAWPKVSVIVPARDEGPKIEAGLRSLLNSDYPHIEVIAIDDRSRDETGAIMDRLAGDATVRDRHSLAVRVIHITELPADWLGKNHALHVGHQESAGDWLLFTDGDVVHRPDTLRRAVRYALARNLDHLPLFPDIAAEGILEAAFVACFGLIFTAGTQPWLVPTRISRFYVGVGAFNLVRRTALDRAGGFVPIKLDVMDDVKLGKLLKQTGSRAEVLRSAEALHIRWQQSAWACITGLEKNAFASADYSVLRLLWMMSVTAVVFFGPVVGAVFAGDSRAGFVAAAILSHGLFGFNAWLFGHSVWLFPMLMPSGAALIFAFLRSGWITLRQGGVRWRDTFYPLNLLRQNVFR